MNILLKTLFLVLTTATTFILPAHAWDIPSFESTITIHPDTHLSIQETIDVDFGNLERHGIYRYIQEKYTTSFNNNYTIRLHVESVTDNVGSLYEYIITNEYPHKKVRIGSPDFTVTGPQTYNLAYNVERAFTRQTSEQTNNEEYIDFFWNVTGSWPEASIQTSKVTYNLSSLPTEAFKEVMVSCYTGYQGSTDKNCSIEKNPSTQSITITSNQVLSPYEQLSAGVAIPAMYLTPPGILQEITWFVTDNWYLGLPFVVFLLFFIRWYKLGRDPRKGPIPTQYEPPLGLSPGELGTLMDDKAHDRDITASLIHLAHHGYLSITETKHIQILFWSNRDYTFTKRKELPEETPELSDADRYFFEKLFKSKTEVEMSSLRNKFYTYIDNIQGKLYASLNQKKLYVRRPDKVRDDYSIISTFVGFFGFILGATLFESFILCGLFILCAIGVHILGKYMPKKTAKGMKAFREALGFKEYLSMTEKDYLAFINAPERTPEQFEKFLPYAMVLGVEKEWSKLFESILTTPPTWYHSNRWNAQDTFHINRLLSSVHDMTSATEHSITSSPSSSSYSSSGGSSFSGGFSGGGFGGGGGGSW